MSFIERRVSTTGGIFSIEDYQTFRKVAEGLNTIGQHVSITQGLSEDDLGRALDQNSVRLVINSSTARLDQYFWIVAVPTRQYRKLLVREGLLSGEELANKVDQFIAQTIQSLPHQTKGRE